MPKHVEAEVSKLEGSPLAERGKFAQAYEYIPPEEDLLTKRGRLFVVLDITADSVFDAPLAGKLVWDSLVEEYFSASDETPLKALEQAVLSAKNRLVSLAHSPDEFGVETEVKLNLGAVTLWENPPVGKTGVLYLARYGEPILFLKRVGQVRELLGGEEASNVASLLVEDGDIVILGSRDFGRSFTPTTLPEISFLEKEFVSGRQVPGLAAIILRLKAGEAEKPEVIKEKEKSVTEPFVPGWKLKIPSVASFLRRLLKRKESLPFPSDKMSKASFLGVALNATITTFDVVASRVKDGMGELADRVVRRFRTQVSRGQEVYLAKRRPEVGLPKVIAALILVLLFSVSFTLWQQRQRARVEEFNRLLSSAEATMDEAEDLVGLSDERAKELWGEAKGELAKAVVLNPKDERLGSLSQRVEALFNLIEKITPVSEKHLFYDLALQPFDTAPPASSSGPRGQGEQVQALSLAGGGKTIYVAEGKTGATLAIKSATGAAPAGGQGPPQVEEATANEVKGAERIGVGGEFLYLLTGKNFYRYNLKTGKKDNPLNFNRYGKIAAFDLYLERNVYFLVPSENQIYKFLDLGGSYSRVLDWLKEPLVLEEAVDIAIDGAIWVLNKGGAVLKLLAGKKEPFSFKNLPSPLSHPLAIYTRPNFKRIYVADGDRVAVFEKDGRFIKQFKGEALTDLIDLWVTDDEKTLFLLTQSKIYKIGL